MKIYIVTGSTGEYSDWTEWDVKAFQEEKAAACYTELLNDWCKAYGYQDNKEHVFFETEPNPYDNNFSCYGQTYYTYHELELVEYDE
jgi:hypothetical protein